MPVYIVPHVFWQLSRISLVQILGTCAYVSLISPCIFAFLVSFYVDGFLPICCHATSLYMRDYLIIYIYIYIVHMCCRDPPVFFICILCGTFEHLYYCSSLFRGAISRNVGAYSVLEERFSPGSLFVWGIATVVANDDNRGCTNRAKSAPIRRYCSVTRGSFICRKLK
jgi:hypothetical protein